MCPLVQVTVYDKDEDGDEWILGAPPPLVPRPPFLPCPTYATCDIKDGALSGNASHLLKVLFVNAAWLCGLAPIRQSAP